MIVSDFETQQHPHVSVNINDLEFMSHKVIVLHMPGKVNLLSSKVNIGCGIELSGTSERRTCCTNCDEA